MSSASSIPPLIFVQVETTGFDVDHDQVVVIAAEKDEETLSRRILPTVQIKPEARAINNLSVVDGALFYHFDRITSNVVKRRKAWYDFIHFIAKFPRPLLLAHDAALQEQFVRKEIERVGLSAMLANKVQNVSFVDTLHIFRELAPDCTDYQLKALAEGYLDFFKMEGWEYYSLPMYKLHVLKCLMEKFKVTWNIITRHSVQIM